MLQVCAQVLNYMINSLISNSVGKCPKFETFFGSANPLICVIVSSAFLPSLISLAPVDTGVCKAWIYFWTQTFFFLIFLSFIVPLNFFF